MLPSRPTPPPQRMLKTLAWIRLPIRPSARLPSLPVGRLGLPCHRVKNRHWGGRRTPSSLLSVTPPLSVPLTLKTTLPASGPLRCHAPLVSPWIWTPPRGSHLSPSHSRHPSWSLQCGTANTSPLRTRSSLPSRGPSHRKPLTFPMPGHTPHPARLRKAKRRRSEAIRLP